VIWHRRRRAERLVAHASHELRGPLAAAALALHGLPPETAAPVAAQLDRMRLALDDLVAAPRGDRAPDRPEPVSVAGFVAGLVMHWRPVAAACGRSLELMGGLPGGLVAADRTRLAQAAGNLVANALEHGEGPVRLRATVRLEVLDDGPGLPAPVHELAARRSRGGHGHGLAVAADIAQRHGGRVVGAPSGVALELPLVGAPR
jgi:signal transduction histidine kinase